MVSENPTDFGDSLILPFTDVDENTVFPELKSPQPTTEYSNYYEVDKDSRLSDRTYDTQRFDENKKPDYYDGSGEVAAASIRGTLRI